MEGLNCWIAQKAIKLATCEHGHVVDYEVIWDNELCDSYELPCSYKVAKSTVHHLCFICTSCANEFLTTFKPAHRIALGYDIGKIVYYEHHLTWAPRFSLPGEDDKMLTRCRSQFTIIKEVISSMTNGDIAQMAGRIYCDLLMITRGKFDDVGNMCLTWTKS